ncbi:hypothetical protein [Dictyobacter kobayashii]|uniref:Uncharacterized protein n=1 Tax=Dictyobacter kobayashii TaxID=2014872 RepID=A0A402ATW4_9CHLR|nr:hypothetical protein [Dictyobacter kobayashii]GCE22505.1 hypothetical protein KDK_63050 [Dictyobacter kobayashii]
MSFYWLEDARGHALYHDTEHIVSLAPFVAADSESVRYRDEVISVDDGVFRWTRYFKLECEAPRQSVRLTMEAVAAYNAAYMLIPAISYNGNHWVQGMSLKAFFIMVHPDLLPGIVAPFQVQPILKGNAGLWPYLVLFLLLLMAVPAHSFPARMKRYTRCSGQRRSVQMCIANATAIVPVIVPFYGSILVRRECVWHT